MSLQFSVLLSVYFNEKPDNLQLALDSLLYQTLLPTEVVLVIDGPITEQIKNIVNKFCVDFSSTQIIELPDNVGLGQALRIGLESCNFEYVARMDTDDICVKDRFEIQINHLHLNPHISVLGTAVEEFDAIPGDLKRFRQLPSQKKKLELFAKYRNPLNHPTVIFKKKDVFAVGSYQHMPLFEDYYLWIRLISNGYYIENLTQPLLYFRVGNDMIGRRHGVQYFKNEYAFLKEVKGLGFINEKQFLLSIILKFPMRIFPKRVLEFIYKKFLR